MARRSSTDLTFKVEDVAPETKTEWSYDRSPAAKTPKAATSFNGAVPGPGQEVAKTTAVAGLSAKRRFYL